MASTPSSVEDHLGVLERFVVLLYDRASSSVVNEASKQAALLEHTNLPGRLYLGTDVGGCSLASIPW
ncbi:hypothetical protein Hamer_G004762 [Homarus americanus]|uniref:Uncharacterized protein n=1 Tax=Homarus americanus TaxID=6706 RepID=A0A8J5JW86_HOMAM|nr:hypothetical protein Hamer_G004762 [Homarus americanus]